MIKLPDYETVLQQLGREYFVENVEFVPDLEDSCKDIGVDLQEPGQPMTVILEDSRKLRLIAQSEVPQEQLSGVINGLSVRWALKDTATDIPAKLDSTKKRLGYCFLKDYARTVPNVGGDEMQEDEWALREMDRLGFFLE